MGSDEYRYRSRGGKIYTEQRRTWFLWILLLCVFIGLGYTIWLAIRIYQSGWDSDLLISTIVLTGFFLPVFSILTWVFRGYFIRLNENGLNFGYSGWNVHLDHSQIIYVKEVRIRWVEWGGMGLRMKGLKQIGYILHNGPGIEISTKHKDRTYTLNCEDPQTILHEFGNHNVKIKK